MGAIRKVHAEKKKPGDFKTRKAWLLYRGKEYMDPAEFESYQDMLDEIMEEESDEELEDGDRLTDE